MHRAGGQSLRNTDDMRLFYGIEADYDEGKVSMQEAFRPPKCHPEFQPTFVAHQCPTYP